MDQIVSNLVARVSWAGVKDGRVMWGFNARVSAPGDSAVKWGNQSSLFIPVEYASRHSAPLQ